MFWKNKQINKQNKTAVCICLSSFLHAQTQYLISSHYITNQPVFLCSSGKYEHAIDFNFDPENLINISSYSLVLCVFAQILYFQFAFIPPSLNSYSILFSPSLFFPPLERVSLVRATCLWHCLKIRLPIKSWKVESGGRMCVPVYVWHWTLCFGGSRKREPVYCLWALFNILLTIKKYVCLVKLNLLDKESCNICCFCYLLA